MEVGNIVVVLFLLRKNKFQGLSQTLQESDLVKISTRVGGRLVTPVLLPYTTSLSKPSTLVGDPLVSLTLTQFPVRGSLQPMTRLFLLSTRCVYRLRKVGDSTLRLQ